MATGQSTTASAVSAAAPTNSAPSTQIYGSSTVTNANTANPTITNAPVSSTPAVTTPTNTSITPPSPTTLSNNNKINSVPTIQNNTAALANTGSIQNPDGSVTNSNGTLTAAPTPPVNAPNPNSTPNPATTTTGGYDPSTEEYFPPGATVPLDANGQPISLLAQSPTDTTIMNSLQNQITQSDAITASIVQGIQTQYAQYIQQQETANSSQQAKTNTALLAGGVTGQGSSSQYAPVSSQNIMQQQVSYGVQQISDLQNKENQAVIQAQQAGQKEDFQLQDELNTLASNIRDTKVAAATTLNNQIAAQNQAVATQKYQNAQDNAIGSLYNSGITDPSEILSYLTSQGYNTLTASDVNTAIKNLTPANQASIQGLASQAAAAGADPALVQQIANSSDFSSALTLATPALGAATANKLAEQAFTNNVDLQNLAINKAKASAEEETAGATAELANAKVSAIVNSSNAAAVLSYAQQYLATGIMPTAAVTNGLEGAVTAQVQDSAGSPATIPRPTGMIYNTTTGVADPKITPETEQSITQMQNMVTNILPELNTEFASSPTDVASGNSDQQLNDYQNTVASLQATLTALSSAGILKGSVADYQKLIPNDVWGLNTNAGKSQLVQLTQNLTDDLTGYLNSNSLSIEGFSPNSLPSSSAGSASNLSQFIK